MALCPRTPCCPERGLHSAENRAEASVREHLSAHYRQEKSDIALWGAGPCIQGVFSFEKGLIGIRRSFSGLLRGLRGQSMAFACDLPPLSQVSLSAWTKTAQDSNRWQAFSESWQAKGRCVCLQQNRLRQAACCVLYSINGSPDTQNGGVWWFLCLYTSVVSIIKTPERCVQVFLEQRKSRDAELTWVMGELKMSRTSRGAGLFLFLKDSV